MAVAGVKENPMSIVIGTGVLTWEPSERRSDRYGYVFLANPGGSSKRDTGEAPLRVPGELLGKPCSLSCRVLETRDSTHIGDLFHGIFPRTPKVGDVIHLGMGLLSLTGTVAKPRIGLMPVESQDSNQWLNIRSLYERPRTDGRTDR
jgi:hypothetical protein